MKKSTLLESNQSDYIAFAGDSATFEEFLSKVKENGLEGEFTKEELKKIYTENKPKTKKEGLSPYGDDAYLVAPNKAKMKKEDIIKAIKEILAEEITQIDPADPSKSKQDLKTKARKQNKLTPELETAINNAPPKEVFDLEEDDHQDPNDESDMAKTQLYATAKYAIELLKMIQDGTQLDAWVQSKITKAADYIDSVKHYMEGEMYLAGTTEEPVNEDFAKFDTLKMAIVQHEKGAPYYDKTRLINIFKQLDSPDQERAKREYSQYFRKSVKETKKELDPVGKEDSDINNDGKVDKTDKYLKNKRVKIGQAIAQHKKN